MKLTEHFSLEEFACGDRLPPLALHGNVRALASVLQVLRNHLGKPIKITSGWRTHEHNVAIGGARNSPHLWGWAADIVVPGVEHADVAQAFEDIFGDQPYGLGLYNRHVHIDLGPKRRWKGVSK